METFLGDFCLKAPIMINALMHVLFIFFKKIVFSLLLFYNVLNICYLENTSHGFAPKPLLVLNKKKTIRKFKKVNEIKHSLRENSNFVISSVCAYSVARTD